MASSWRTVLMLLLSYSVLLCNHIQSVKRDSVDFTSIPVHQNAMHDRLENWARSLFSGAGSSASPMFRLYRTTDQYHPPRASMPHDAHDAIKISQGVRELPQDHRQAINWYYVKPGSPGKACRDIGCTMADLARLTIDGRQMLINRRV